MRCCDHDGKALLFAWKPPLPATALTLTREKAQGHSNDFPAYLP